MATIPEQADAIVIGAGPAGVVVATRLAEDGRRVVLVEAGPGGPRPSAVAGLDLVAASNEASRHWPDLTVRDRVGGRPRPYRQGRGLGGGSMINGMLLTRGDRIDYQRWAGEWGCHGWDHDAMVPWLDRAAATPTQRVPPGPVSVALGQAAAADGVPVGGSSLEPDRLGVLLAELSAVDSRRWSAPDGALGGDGPSPDGVWSPGPASLTVACGRPVDRILAGDGGRSHQARLRSGEAIEAPTVVVCAGAIASPSLLARSGVTGRPLGQALVEHPSFAFTLVLRDDRSALAAAADNPSAVSTLVRWSSGQETPGDLQAIAVDRVAPPGYRGPPLAVVAVGLMAVTSRGRVRPDGNGPGVVTGALTDAGDRRRFRSGLRTVARWLGSPPFAEVVEAVHLDEDGRPLADVAAMTDAELDRLALGRSGPYAHPAGTCPLGPPGADRAVTSIEPGRFGELIDRPGLRVADASVFPDLVRGGLQLPVTAVAARIADDLVAGG